MIGLQMDAGENMGGRFVALTVVLTIGLTGCSEFPDASANADGGQDDGEKHDVLSDGSADAGHDGTIDAEQANVRQDSGVQLTDSAPSIPDVLPGDSSLPDTAQSSDDGGTDVVADTSPSDSSRPDADRGDVDVDGAVPAPVITAIDGDGTRAGIVDVDDASPDLGNRVEADHRFQRAWWIEGEHLGAVDHAELQRTDGDNVFMEDDGLRFEEGGTPMRRKLLLPVGLVAGAYLLTLTGTNGIATAQIYVLQGEPGSRGEPGLPCWDVNGNGVQNENEDINDDGNWDTRDCQPARGELASLTSRIGRIEEGHCPQGYNRDADDRGPEGFWVVCKGDIDLDGNGEPDASEHGGPNQDELVKVGNFWIDRYEMVGGGGNIGQPTGHNTTAQALSSPGRRPTVNISWLQAAQMCVNAGKQLCTNAEWQAAVSGTPDPGDGVLIPGGGAAEDACNVASNPGRGVHAGQSGEPANTGSHVDCVTRFGAFDMIGNVWEWTAEWYSAGQTWQDAELETATPWPGGFGEDITWNINGRARNGATWSDGLPAAGLRGGTWSIGTGAGAFALGVAGGPAHSGANIGARCCVCN